MNAGAVSFTGGTADQRTAVLQLLEPGFYHDGAYQNIGNHLTYTMEDPIGYTAAQRAHVSFVNAAAFDANAFAWHRYGSITTDVLGSAAAFTMELDDSLEAPLIYDVIAHMLGHWIIDIISQFPGPVGELNAAVGGGPWGGGGDNALEGACEVFRELTLLGVSSTRSLSAWKATRDTVEQAAMTLQGTWPWSFPVKGEVSPQSNYAVQQWKFVEHREEIDLSIGSILQTGSVFSQSGIDVTTDWPQWTPSTPDYVGWVVDKGGLYFREQPDPSNSPPSSHQADRYGNPYWSYAGPTKQIVTYPWGATNTTSYLVRREMRAKRFPQFASLVDLHGTGSFGSSGIRLNWMASSDFEWPIGPVILPGYYTYTAFAYPLGAYYASTAGAGHGPGPYTPPQWWGVPKGVINTGQWAAAYMDWNVFCEVSVDPLAVVTDHYNPDWSSDDRYGNLVREGGASWRMSHGLVPIVPFWSEVNLGRVTSGVVRH